MSYDQVRIFDTTLRDGEQAPGFSMTEDGKLRMARALAALKVDVIEAGFAAASPGDSRAIAGIAERVEGPIICSLAKATRGDVKAPDHALQSASLSRFLSREVVRPEGTKFSTRCHDDLGMAGANPLTGVRGGARQIECAVNGIGERAGNCSRDILPSCVTAYIDAASKAEAVLHVRRMAVKEAEAG